MRARLNTTASRLVLNARGVWRDLARTARLACGIGDYEAYVAHRRALHPGAPVLSYADFFRERQDARFGSGVARCC